MIRQIILLSAQHPKTVECCKIRCAGEQDKAAPKSKRGVACRPNDLPGCINCAREGDRRNDKEPCGMMFVGNGGRQNIEVEDTVSKFRPESFERKEGHDHSGHYQCGRKKCCDALRQMPPGLTCLVSPNEKQGHHCSCQERDHKQRRFHRHAETKPEEKTCNNRTRYRYGATHQNGDAQKPERDPKIVRSKFEGGKMI